jgi:hypothetical protein
MSLDELQAELDKLQGGGQAPGQGDSQGAKPTAPQAPGQAQKSLKVPSVVKAFFKELEL